jgi:hypothetical protein
VYGGCLESESKTEEIFSINMPTDLSAKTKNSEYENWGYPSEDDVYLFFFTQIACSIHTHIYKIMPVQEKRNAMV